MGLFRITPEERLNALAKRSKGILDVFTSTISDLTVVNADIDVLAKEREAEKATIEQHLVSLATEKENNSKVIDKINSIFA